MRLSAVAVGLGCFVLISGCTKQQDAVLPRFVAPAPVETTPRAPAPVPEPAADVPAAAPPPVAEPVQDAAAPKPSVPLAPAPAPTPVPELVAPVPPVQEKAVVALSAAVKETVKKEQKEVVKPASSVDALPVTAYRVQPHVRLPGSSVANRGRVRALVLPVALGGERPTWDETQLAEAFFGPTGFRRELFDVSGGVLNVDADIFPALLDPTVQVADLFAGPDADRHLAALARRVVVEWGKRANLASWDNDGPDGKPMSGDDDGDLDLVYLVIESSSIPARAEVQMDVVLPVGRGGRLEVRARRVQILSVPPRGSTEDFSLFHRYALDQSFRFLGLESRAAFFPAPLSHVVSTATRVRMGWTALARIEQQTDVRGDLSKGAVFVPVMSSRDEGWLVEHRGEDIFVSRVRETRGGALETLSVVRYPSRSPESFVLPLSGGPHPRSVRFSPTEDGCCWTLKFALSEAL